jgi:membrane-bound ClpP family serine protease
MILGGIVEEDEDEARQKSAQRQDKRRSELESFIGKQGTAITVLRPVGVVRIDGIRVDALAETGSIEANSLIEVTAVYDNQVKVRVVPPQD